MSRYIIAFCVIFFGLTQLTFAQKDDTVRLYNGDRITGELKKLQYGILDFKTSDMGTLAIEWAKVKSIKTKKFFEIYLGDNSKYFGRIDSSFVESERIQMLMRMEGTDRYLDLIVKFNPIKGRILDRIDINLEVGYQYNKGSQVSNINTGYKFYYRNLKDEITLQGSNYITNQIAEDTEFKKQDVELSYNRYYKKSWKAGVNTSAQQNTELGLDRRLLVGASAGKSLIQNLRSDLEVFSGLSANTEKSTDNTNTKNLEVMIGSSYKFFILHHPEVSIDTDATIYPSLTTKGRFRATINFNMKIEVFKDFYFNLKFYDNFDNMPPTTTASTNDFGITTSVSYSF